MTKANAKARPAITATVETVTPEAARQWLLANNIKNRPLRATVVAKKPAPGLVWRDGEDFPKIGAKV